MHTLADVTVAMYRCHDVAPEITDALAAVLMRSQICLLAIWMFIGRERFSWRVCGLIAGSCLIFTVYSRLLFPGLRKPSDGVFWYVKEWMYFFRPSGPGDFLVKLPVILVGMGVPLVGWRIIRAIRNRHRGTWFPPLIASWQATARRWLQFRFQDVAIWILTVACVLGAVYTTPPYDGWFVQLADLWWQIFGHRTAASLYSLVVSVLYVAVAAVAIWAVHSKQRLRTRIFVVSALTIVGGSAFEVWRSNIATEQSLGTWTSMWYLAAPESVLAALSAGLIAGSLSLVVFYDSPIRPAKPMPGRRLPDRVPPIQVDPITAWVVDEPNDFPGGIGRLRVHSTTESPTTAAGAAWEVAFSESVNGDDPLAKPTK